MMSEKKILIMMTTYNGEAFIKEQIDSIIHQTSKNWDLIIRDDQSTDDTVAIIEDYRLQYPQIELLQNKSDNHGAYYNFFALIDYVKKNKNDYDYFMLSDQDDIWDLDKIQKFHDYYNRVAKDQFPALVYGDMRIIGENDQVKDPSIDKLIGTHYSNAVSTFFSHRVFGCSTFFNNRLLKELVLPNIDDQVLRYLSHDNYIAKTAALTGQIYYLSETTMGYRRGIHNVTQKHQYNHSIKRIAKRLLGLNQLAKDHALTYKQTLVAITLFKKKDLDDWQYELLARIENIIRKGGVSAIAEMKRLNISFGMPVKNFSRKLIVLLGNYKKFLE